MSFYPLKGKIISIPLSVPQLRSHMPIYYNGTIDAIDMFNSGWCNLYNAGSVYMYSLKTLMIQFVETNFTSYIIPLETNLWEVAVNNGFVDNNVELNCRISYYNGGTDKHNGRYGLRSMVKADYDRQIAKKFNQRYQSIVLFPDKRDYYRIATFEVPVNIKYHKMPAGWTDGLKQMERNPLDIK